MQINSLHLRLEEILLQFSLQFLIFLLEFYSHPFGKRLKSEGLSHALQNSPPDCFVPSLRSGRPFESYPSIKKEAARKGSLFFWCERWDSNPHGITTRTSNVLVYHSNTLASA